ncbi:hypothetical protein MTO96_009754 [Rhipicephalus appendiculatus]
MGVVRDATRLASPHPRSLRPVGVGAPGALDLAPFQEDAPKRPLPLAGSPRASQTREHDNLRRGYTARSPDSSPCAHLARTRMKPPVGLHRGAGNGTSIDPGHSVAIEECTTGNGSRRPPRVNDGAARRLQKFGSEDEV